MYNPFEEEVKKSNSSHIVKSISDTMVGNTFHHHFHILYDIRTILGSDKKIYTEIGTYHGGSICTILQHPFETECHCIDPMVVGSNQLDLFDANLTKFNKYSRRVTLHRNYSTDPILLDCLKEFKTDILFIDGDHTFQGVM